MSTKISLTELRQRLFQLADHVADTGEPLVIVRNGVRLKLVREDASVVVGPPLDPRESPAEWSGESSKVAEPKAEYRAPARKRPRSRRT